jgi:hypothetical protein
MSRSEFLGESSDRLTDHGDLSDHCTLAFWAGVKCCSVDSLHKHLDTLCSLKDIQEMYKVTLHRSLLPI